MKLFNSSIDWMRVLIVISAVTASWTSLSTIIPNKYHRVGEGLLTAATVFVTTLIRPNKWQARSEEQPMKVTLNTATDEIQATNIGEPDKETP